MLGAMTSAVAAYPTAAVITAVMSAAAAQASGYQTGYESVTVEDGPDGNQGTCELLGPFGELLCYSLLSGRRSNRCSAQVKK
jgi:hypothetical protein